MKKRGSILIVIISLVLPLTNRLDLTKNKEMSQEYESSILIAINKYPELENDPNLLKEIYIKEQDIPIYYSPKEILNLTKEFENDI